MFKKFITVLTIFSLMFGQVGVALAEDSLVPPPPPEAPTAPAAPTAPEAPAAPTSPTSPTAPTLEEILATPTPAPVTPTPTPRPTHTPRPTPTPTVEPTQASASTAVLGTDNGGTNANGQNGGATINTADANSSALLASDANSNLATLPSGSGGGATVVNTGNGAGSVNDASSQSTTSTVLIQDNNAQIANGLNQAAITGNNSASNNTNGDSTIVTGDANVSGTVITTANTNAAGISMSEFNIPTDQIGDYVLDFSANCVYNCSNGSGSVANTGNGAGSTNTASNVNVVDTATFQTNNADIDNSLVLKANTGDNLANRNTGGDSSITTGDANVSANALTLANNNIEGQVIYGVVNIYGDLHGDIIFPEDQFAPCCGTPNTTVANSNNGAGSVNDALVDITNTDTTVQTNVASINNGLTLNAQTGDNSTSRNTDGSSGITTGDSSITASVVNIANSNISGDTWLVLVNNAGTWTGQIMGADGNYAGSAGTEFTLGPDGSINVTNAGNGADSTNTASTSVTNNNTTVQTNNVNLNNNLDLTANTGNNSASRNTGGTSSVTTGDANIVANLVNFVNNNISHNGRLVVTVVNVFGSWVGDFIGPGQHKDPVVVPQEISLVSVTPTPQPTSAPSNNAAVSASVASTPTPTVKPQSQLGSASVVKVAGYSTENLAGITEVLSTAPSTKDNVIHVNLAWVLLLLPAGGILLITKKKLLH